MACLLGIENESSVLKIELKIIWRGYILLGVIQKLHGHNFAIFSPSPSTSAWTVFTPWAWTKTDIFWPPPHLVHVVIEWPLIIKVLCPSGIWWIRRGNRKRQSITKVEFTQRYTNPMLICTWFKKNQFWKIKFDKSSLKNQVWKIKFVKSSLTN